MRTLHRLAALLVIVASLAVAACSAERPTCAVVDWSGSGELARPEYVTYVSERIEDVGAEGGEAAVVVAQGDPTVQAKVVRKSFGDVKGTELAGQRAARIDELLAEVAEEAGRPDATPGSSIMAGIALVSRQGCGAIAVLSDGLETGDVDVYHDEILTPAGRRALLDRLEDDDRLPDLGGVDLLFPYGGYVPQGTKLSRDRLSAIERLWRDYADRTGATIRWRQ